MNRPKAGPSWATDLHDDDDDDSDIEYLSAQSDASGNDTDEEPSREESEIRENVITIEVPPDFLLKSSPSSPSSPTNGGSGGRHGAGQPRKEARAGPHVGSHASEASPRPTSNSNREPYTSKENRRILRYIKENKLYRDKIKGNLVWKKMAAANVVPNRSWASLKDHFRRYLMHDLDWYSDRSIEPRVKSKIKEAMEPKVNQDAPKTFKPYSDAEDMAIVEYVTNHVEEGYGLKGNGFWQRMTKHNTIPDRTWEGVRERFTKRIVLNLHRYAQPVLSRKKAEFIMRYAKVKDDKCSAILTKLEEVSPWWRS